MFDDSARTLEALGMAVDPMSAPLSYPGRPPDGRAALLTGRCLLAVRPGAEPVGRWLVEGRTLETALAELRAAPLTARQPVLAVGSNASPAQLARKFGRAGPGAVVPMTTVRVDGLAVGVSAHIGRFGYVPATPVPGPAPGSPRWVTWLDETQLLALDATEPNYHRVAVPTVKDTWMYVSRHGHLTDRAGMPRRLGTQAELLWGLLGDIPALAAMAGPDPVAVAASARADPDLRDRIRRLFRSAGLVGPGWRR